MKLRSPGGRPPSFQSSQKPQYKFTVTTLTPLYGGGVAAGEPDMDLPVRAASIRGQLRYWWRLLQRHHPTEPIRDSAELFRQERALWGGMAENGEDHASKVRLRIKGKDITMPVPKTESCQDFLNKQHKQRESAFKYALFSAMGGGQSLIPAGLQFSLKIECCATCSTAQQDEVLTALRWWASFGGLGARTRRGLGAVHVVGHGMEPVSTEEAETYGFLLRKKTKDGRAIKICDDATEAWQQAVEPLRLFRQGTGIGRRPGMGRSFWPEADSIREITNQPNRKTHPSARHHPEHPARISFPRAILGLPIVFEFKNGFNDPDKTELSSTHEGGRMASPVILKPMALANGQYAAIALRLPLDEITELAVQLKKVGSTRPLRGFPPGNWWNASKANDVAPIRDYHGSDALEAFLNYFPLPSTTKG